MKQPRSNAVPTVKNASQKPKKLLLHGLSGNFKGHTTSKNTRPPLDSKG